MRYIYHFTTINQKPVYGGLEIDDPAILEAIADNRRFSPADGMDDETARRMFHVTEFRRLTRFEPKVLARFGVRLPL